MHRELIEWHLLRYIDIRFEYIDIFFDYIDTR